MQHKSLIAFGIALTAAGMLPALADHRADMPFSAPTQAMFSGGTHQVTFTPPPAPPPPPALPSATPVNLLPVNINMPGRSTILPTDTLSIRTPVSIHNAKNAPPPGPLPAGWDRWDKRYDFRDQNWILFNEAYYTDKSGVIHHSKITEKTGVTGKLAAEKATSGNAYEAGTEFSDVLSKKVLAQGSFIPTSTTHVTKVNETTLQLTKGAVVVMSPARSIKVCTGIGGMSCVSFQGKSIGMVSVYDDKLTVVNLTDACCGSMSVTFPTDSKRPSMAVESGQVLELYHDAQSPTSNLVATRILSSERLNEHHCCLVCQLNYIRALKKYQLEASLPKRELERVLKTAAAMASLGR